MSGENKVIWVIIGISIVSIVGIFGVMLALSPKKLTEVEKSKFLVQSDNYVQGKSDAKITMVAFEDFQCPACGAAQDTLKRIKIEYKDDLKFIFRHFPLRTIHANAQTASQAAEAAGTQGKFYEYHDVLFANQNEWSTMSGDELIKVLVGYAKLTRVKDLKKFESDVRENVYSKKINRDYSNGTSLGVNGTPTIFINGDRISNSSYQGIKIKIEELLKK